MEDRMKKYPRTPHLEGSRLQAGDEPGFEIPYRELAGRYIVVEEKMDGANAGISFSPDASLLLQSRGHYLVGGGREKHFSMLKQWAAAREDDLFDILGDRYLMFGEYMAAKHTVYYNALPHLFLEFDIYDKEQDLFLSTAARREMIDQAPIISVPVLYAGIAPRRLEDLLALIGRRPRRLNGRKT